MDKCRLNGSPVYASDIYGINNTINIEYEIMLRKASQNSELKCEECGTDIIFRHGKYRRAYFAHKNNSNDGGCGYSKETEEHILGKQIVKLIMKKRYPDIYSEARYTFSNKKWADLYFRIPTGEELIVEFQRKINTITEWENKNTFYKEKGYNVLWIVSGSADQLRNLTREYEFSFDHRFINNKNDGILIVLDTKIHKIIIVKKLKLVDYNGETYIDKMFSKEYEYTDIKININGTLECDFEKEYEKVKQNFIKTYKKELEDYNNQKRLYEIKITKREEERNKVRKLINDRKTGKIKDFKKTDKFYEYLVRESIRYKNVHALISVINENIPNAREKIEELFKKEIKENNKVAKEIYDKLIFNLKCKKQ